MKGKKGGQGKRGTQYSFTNFSPEDEAKSTETGGAEEMAAPTNGE